VKLNLVDLASSTQWRPARIRIRHQRAASMGEGDYDPDNSAVPASGLIFEQVHNRLAGIQQIGKVKVDLVWEPKWTPHRISEAGRRQLGI